MEAAREELDRTWDEAERAVSAPGEPIGDGFGSDGPLAERVGPRHEVL